MVTGDNLRTAKAIALECGILATSEEATAPTIIEGRVFRELSEKDREQVAKNVTVCFKYHDFSRSIFVYYGFSLNMNFSL
jgi:magnesium-transporting ATPase (P-type)